MTRNLPTAGHCVCDHQHKHPQASPPGRVRRAAFWRRELLVEGGECALKPYNNNDNIIPDECTLFVLILFFFFSHIWRALSGVFVSSRRGPQSQHCELLLKGQLFDNELCEGDTCLNVSTLKYLTIWLVNGSNTRNIYYYIYTTLHRI